MLLHYFVKVETLKMHVNTNLPFNVNYKIAINIEEWLVSAVMSMYTGAKTVVRTVYGNRKGFEVKVGMHQGSGLSPLLFVIVMEARDRCKWRKMIKEAR